MELQRVIKSQKAKKRKSSIFTNAWGIGSKRFYAFVNVIPIETSTEETLGI